MGFKLRSGNKPRFKDIGSTTAFPKTEANLDLGEKLNLKDKLNIEKPKIDIKKSKPTPKPKPKPKPKPRASEYRGDKKELKDPGREERRTAQLEGQGYSEVNVVRGDKDINNRRKGSFGDMKSKQYSHEQFTSEGSDPVTRSIRVPKEKEQWKGKYKGTDPYTSEFLGGHTSADMSQAKPLVYNQSTGKWVPHEEVYYGETPGEDSMQTPGWGVTDYERIESDDSYARRTPDKHTKKQGVSMYGPKTGRLVKKGKVRPELGEGWEKYITKGEGDRKAVRIDDEGRQVHKSDWDEKRDMTIDKSSKGWLNLKDRQKTHYDPQGNVITDVKAYKKEIRDAKKRYYQQKRENKKIRKEQERQSRKNPELIPGPDGKWMKNPNYIPPV